MSSEAKNDDLEFPVRLPPATAFTRALEPAGPTLSLSAQDTGEPQTDPDGPGHLTGGRPPEPPPERRRRSFGALGWLMLTLLGTAALGVIAFAARKDIAREVAQGWLSGQGIPSRLRIDQLNFSHVSGQASLGAPDSPDLMLESFSVDYDLNLFKAGQPLARVRTVRLVRPDLRFTYDEKGLNLGTLQPFLQRTGTDTASAPPDTIAIEDARLTARTHYGELRGTGSARIEAGRVTSADLTLIPSALNGERAAGKLSSGQITLRPVPGNAKAVHLRARIDADSLTLKSASPTVFAGLNADIDARLPYGEGEALFDGPAKAKLKLSADRLQAQGVDAGNLDATVSATGVIAGQASRFTGQSDLNLQAESLRTQGLNSDSLHVEGQTLNLSADLSGDAPVFTLSGPVRAEAARFDQGSLSLREAVVALDSLDLKHAGNTTDMDFAGRAQARRLTQGELSLNRVDARLDGQAQAGDGGFTARLTGDVRSPEARYGGLIESGNKRARDLAASREAALAAAERATADSPPAPLPPDDPDLLVALARASERFAIEARGVDLSLDSTGFGLSLTQPARLTPASGGRITLTPRAGQPLISNHSAGGFDLVLSGGDLPETTARLSNLTLGSNGTLKGRFTANSAFSFAPLYGANLRANGHFLYTATGTRIDIDDCATLTATRADIGGRLSDITGRICRSGAPLVSLTPQGRWSAQGRFTELEAGAPEQDVTLSEGAGRFTARALEDGLAFTVALETLRAADALEATRFHPVGVKGDVAQDGRALTGKLFVSPWSSAVLTRAPNPIATIDIHSDTRTGVGRADIVAENLGFTPEGLQPLDLTPLVSGVATRDVSGSLSFTGHFGWSKDGTDSGGVLKLNGVDFDGPLGQAAGLKGDVIFTSLAPLATDPGQPLSADSFTTLVPLTNIDTRLQIFSDYVRLEQANIISPGGPFQLDPMDVPFDQAKGFQGALRFERLDFGKLIAATDFARDMSFEGTISGRVPFAMSGGTLRFDKGELKGDGPGRVSIPRSALQGSAEGSATAEPESGRLPVQAVEGTVIEQMAYQALEHLSYDRLEATVGSTENGRLAFNFRIRGAYDPPERKTASINLIDYLRGTWMQKHIDLPSGTGVNLNLGMTLNLDEVMQDLVEYDRARSRIP